MNLKRRLSNLSRPRKAVAPEDKEETLAEHRYDQGSPGAVSNAFPDQSSRRGREPVAAYGHGVPNPRHVRAISPPVSHPGMAALSGFQDSGTTVYGGDGSNLASDKPGLPSAAPPTLHASEKRTGVPRLGVGHKQGRQGSSDSRATTGHRESEEGRHHRTRNRETGGLLRLEGSQGWMASRWQGRADRIETGDLNESVDYERRRSCPGRTPPTAVQTQAPEPYNASVIDGNPWYRHSVDAPSVGANYQQNPVTPSEMPGPAVGNSPQFTEEGIHPLRVEQHKESMRQRANLTPEAVDQKSGQESHRPKTESRTTPASTNQEWIQLELDRLKTEFQFKNQIASMLRTTLADLKTQRGTGPYPQPGGQMGSPHGGMPVPPMHSGMGVPGGLMMQGAMPAQGGGMTPSGVQIPGVGSFQSGMPVRGSGMPQSDLQIPGGSPHSRLPPTGPGTGYGNMQPQGNAAPNDGAPAPPGGRTQQPTWQASGYTGGYTGADVIGRDGAHPLLSPSTTPREAALTRELEKKNQHIAQLIAEISALEAQLRVLSDALQQERLDNTELSQRNMVLQGQVDRLATASEKLLKGMTAIRAV